MGGHWKHQEIIIFAYILYILHYCEGTIVMALIFDDHCFIVQN